MMHSKDLKYGSMVKKNEFFKKRLKDVGAKKSCTGFFISVYILELIINQKLEIKSFSKSLYPLVAEKFNKHISCIERDIRTLISSSWNNNMKNKLSKVANFNKKPTCRKFILSMVEYIMLDLK